MLLLATLLTAAPPTGFSTSVERVAVQRHSKDASISVDALTGRVVLTGLALAGKPPRLCPTVEKTRTQVTLVCRTRRLWAALETDARGSFLDLRQLSGVNWNDLSSRIPLRGWSLRTLGIPDQCPGRGAAARGECALQRGELDVAHEAYTEALTGPDVSAAHFRLGDLALHIGDVETALKHYAKVSEIGPVGRLARARRCELTGACFALSESEKVGNTEGLAGEAARELELYNLRRELIAGRDEEALLKLQQALEKDRLFCEGVLPFCQRMVEAGLASADVEAQVSALAIFLMDEVRHGPSEEVLNDAAAKTARELGAPGFAAGILAANTPKIPRGELSAHLLQVVSLYLAANDRVRAAVVLEYAQGKLGAATQGGGWVTVRRQLGRRANAGAAPATPIVDEKQLAELSAQVSLSTDLARAAAARSRATQHPSNQPQQEEPTPETTP